MVMDLKPWRGTLSPLQLFSSQRRKLSDLTKQLFRRWLLGLLFSRDSSGRLVIELPDDVVLVSRSSIGIHSGLVHIKSHSDHLVLETSKVITEDGSIAAIHEQPYWFNGRPSYPLEVITSEDLPCTFFASFDDQGQPILPSGWIAHPFAKQPPQSAHSD